MKAERIIKGLAQGAAHGGLKLHDARAMFDSLYIANALVLARGNKSKAAEIAGIERASLLRIRRRQEQDQ